jgi:hypothetical protein
MNSAVANEQIGCLDHDGSRALRDNSSFFNLLRAAANHYSENLGDGMANALEKGGERPQTTARRKTEIRQ